MFSKTGVTKKNREIIHGLKNLGTNPMHLCASVSGLVFEPMTKWQKYQTLKNLLEVKYTVIRFVSAIAKFAIWTPPWVLMRHFIKKKR
jgi:hypothetical protein